MSYFLAQQNFIFCVSFSRVCYLAWASSFTTKCFDDWVTYQLQLSTLHIFNMETITWNYVQYSGGARYCKVMFSKGYF